MHRKNYEVFTRKSARIANPAVTINPNGKIYLNQGATFLLQIVNAQVVLLLWDEEECKAAIKPTRKNDARAYRIAYSHKGSGASLTARSFLNWINYDVFSDKLITVEAVWDDKEGLLEFNIPPKMIKEYV